MAAVAAIAGVGMMVCCSSSVAAFMMGGDGDDDSSGSGGGGGGGGGGGDGADDSDDDTLDPDRVCPRTVSAQRTDASGGWGMNLSFKCGDETAQIGKGTANKMTAGPLTLAAGACPETVDKTNWLGTATYNDKFGITMSECIDPGETCPRTVSARRTDANGGWGMNLKFKCGDETAEIGNGTANTMTTPTPININEISCPGTVSKANWLGTATYNDKFAITVSDCQ